MSYYIKEKRYPKYFGRDLAKLVISIPYLNKNYIKPFQEISKEKYLKLIQYAIEEDYEDISYLHDVIFQRLKTVKSSYTKEESDIIKDNIDSDIIDYILERLNPHYIDAEITRPIDEARSSYLLNSVNNQSYEELIDTVTKFYIHILRHTNPQNIQPDVDSYSTEALNILNKVYPNRNDYNNFIINGLHGYNGGIRVIFDKITSYLKSDLKEKYITATINEVINPLDYRLKKSLIKEIIDREGSKLEIDKDLLIPDKYVDNYLEIIRAYTESKYRLNNIFIRL
jgi:hypothetical protein